MGKHEFKQFCEIWAVAQELSANGKVYSKPAIVEIFEQLQDFDFDSVKAAIRAHSKQSKFSPTLADIFGLLGKNKPKHIPANEAWAIALKSMDESETVVMTNEIMNARAIAWEVYASGDPTGARMAFRDTYERITEAAGEPQWYVSLGHDPDKRNEAVVKAVDQGLLPESELQKYRIGHSPVSVSRLTHTAKQKPADNSEQILQKLEEMRLMMPTNDGDDNISEKERWRFEEKRKTELVRVSERLGYDINNLH